MRLRNDHNFGIFVAAWYFYVSCIRDITKVTEWQACILAIVKVVITVFSNYIFVLKPSLIIFFSASESMQILLVLCWLETDLEVIN
jgi:uncharacterized membrane protein